MLKMQRIKKGLYEYHHKGKLFFIRYDCTKYPCNAWGCFVVVENIYDVTVGYYDAGKPLYRTSTLKDAKKYLANHLILK